MLFGDRAEEPRTVSERFGVCRGVCVGGGAKGCFMVSFVVPPCEQCSGVRGDMDVKSVEDVDGLKEGVREGGP